MELDTFSPQHFVASNHKLYNTIYNLFEFQGINYLNTCKGNVNLYWSMVKVWYVCIARYLGFLSQVGLEYAC